MKRFACACIAFSVCVASPGGAQPDRMYQAAYQRWCDAIDAHPSFGVPFWLQTTDGPAGLREAVAGLVSFGPNLVPFLVRELRAESDQMRVYRLILLLNRVSGINLYYNSGDENVYAAVTPIKNRFLRDWDAGNYANASALLRKTWKERDPAERDRKIDPRSLTPVRRYGVYAVPFITEELRRRDSPELFAAFLIIADQPDLYTSYIEQPSATFTTGARKLAHVKEWARQNARRMDRLKGLHEQIQAISVQ